MIQFKWALVFGLTFFVSESLFSQDYNQNTEDAASLAMLLDLYEHGVDLKNDSIFINEESKRLISSEEARVEMYPKVYTWNNALKLINNQELKKAFWHLINLSMISEANKNMVVKSVLTYDKMLRMDEVLISTFYTYCYMDPKIGKFKDGKPIIVAPHILEQKLRAVQEIIYYVQKYKNENR